MSDLNTLHNRAVWFDIPVADLNRAQAFYQAVLGVAVERSDFRGTSFCVLAHDQGNGGCLVLDAAAITSTGGILVYFNVDGRIQDAVAKTKSGGGKVVEATHGIGPHGFRAIVLDSEGNRIVLHSSTDA
jgi:uncharacterized protein